MAKVTGPLHSQEASGSVGGLTFRTHRGLTTASAKPIGLSVHSRLKDAQLARMRAAQARWRALSTSLRSSWRTYIKDVSYFQYPWKHYRKAKVTAYAFFLSYAIRQMLMHAPPRDSPPTFPITAYITAAEAHADLNLVTVTWQIEGDYDDNTRIELFIAGPIRPGRTPQPSDWQRDAFIPAANGTWSLDLRRNRDYAILIRLAHPYDYVGPFWALSVHTEG